MATWLKETIESGAGHGTRSLGTSRFDAAKRLIGNLTDDAPYRAGVALSWMTGWCFEFSLIIHTVFAGIILLYMYLNQTGF